MLINKKTYSFALTLLAVTLIAGCGYIDDYAFGKDNMPHPSPLPVVTKKQKVAVDWSMDVGAFPKGTAVPDLQPYINGAQVYVATSNGTVVAANKNTGKSLWRVKLDSGLLAGPVVSNDFLAVNADNSSIVLLDKVNGKRKQSIKVASDSLAKPLLIHDTMFVKTINGVLYSLAIDSGKKNWSYDHGSPEIILKASSSPVKYHQTIVVGFSDGELIGFDENNGHVMWQRHVAFAKGASDIERLVDIDTNPIIDGQNLYIATYQGEIGSYSVESSEFNWHHIASTYHDLAIEADYLIMVDSHDVIWAFNKKSGQVLWKQDALKARGLTAPVIWNHQIWVADSKGALHGISPQSGEFVAQVVLPGSIISAPIVERDVCWVLTTNGQLHRLSMRK